MIWKVKGSATSVNIYSCRLEIMFCCEILKKNPPSKYFSSVFDYANVACKLGIISTLISPARLVKCQATNIDQSMQTWESTSRA